jgi:hypothetical protein
MEHDVIGPEHDTFPFLSLLVYLLLVNQLVVDPLDFGRERLDVDVARLSFHLFKHLVKRNSGFLACNIPPFDIKSTQPSFTGQVITVGIELVEHRDPAFDIAPVAGSIERSLPGNAPVTNAMNCVPSLNLPM